MAKRDTAIGKMKKSRSYKTKKRLAAKAKMLEFKALKPSERRVLSAKGTKSEKNTKK